VMHLMRGVKERVFPVGGWTIIARVCFCSPTTGEFAHRLTGARQPRNEDLRRESERPLTEAEASFP